MNKNEQTAREAAASLSKLRVYGYGDKTGEKLLPFLPDSAAGDQVKAIILRAIEEAQSADKKRLDWLSHCVWEDGYCFSADRPWDGYAQSYVNHVGLFTVPSQWVRANSLREAIDAAMASEDATLAKFEKL